MKVDPAYLVDLDTAAEQVAVYVAGLTFEQFRDNSMVHDAILYNFAVCGEAVRNLSKEFRDAHPEIEWARIVVFRNRVTHDYANLDLQVVWPNRSVSYNRFLRLRTFIKNKAH